MREWLGITRREYVAIEEGERAPNADQHEAICEFFGWRDGWTLTHPGLSSTMRLFGRRIDPLDLVVDLFGSLLIIGGTTMIVGALLVGGEVFVLFLGVVVAFAGWSMVKDTVNSFRRRRKVSKDRRGVPARADAWWKREEPEG